MALKFSEKIRISNFWRKLTDATTKKLAIKGDNSATTLTNVNKWWQLKA